MGKRKKKRKGEKAIKILLKVKILTEYKGLGARSEVELRKRTNLKIFFFSSVSPKIMLPYSFTVS